MAASINPLNFLSTAASPATGAPAATTKSDKLANEDTFLQLLIAQIKNQDPLKPADGIEFVTQLAQFSQLEQLTSIRNVLDTRLVQPDTAVHGAAAPAPVDTSAGTGNAKP